MLKSPSSRILFELRTHTLACLRNNSLVSHIRHAYSLHCLRLSNKKLISSFFINKDKTLPPSQEIIELRVINSE